MPGKWTGGTADANDARLMTSGTLAVVVDGTTQEVALPKGLALLTNIASPTIPIAGTMRLYGDSTSGVLTAIDGSTGRSSTAIGLMPGTSQWLKTFSATTGGFTASQPAFTDISGVITGSQLPAFTGDVTKPLGSTVQTLANIPNDTTAAGDILFANIASPATPGAGTNRVWTNSQLLCKNDIGTISSTAQAKASVASQWLNSFSTATGQFTSSQPAFTDISGTIAGSQLPAFTGDVTKPLGSTVQTLANIPNDTPMPGDLFTTVISTPATPSAGHGRAFHLNLGGGLWGFINSVGVVSNTVIPTTATANQFLVNIDTGGVQVKAQPAFTDISGVIAAAQLPAFTGDVTKPAGSTVQTLANIPNDVPAAGDILFTDITSPSIPAAGHMRVYGDSSSGVLTAIDGSAGRSSTAIGITPSANNWIKTFDATTGGFTSQQVAFTNISGTIGASQYTFGISLAHLIFGYNGSTPGPLITTGATLYMRNEQQSVVGAQVIQWRCPIALADIEAYLQVDTWNDAGSGGNYTVTLVKNGSATANTVNVTSTGSKQLTGGPVTFSAGDLYGFKVTCGGTTGVRTDFTLFARGKTV
jgi:hypothetical protein